MKKQISNYTPEQIVSAASESSAAPSNIKPTEAHIDAVSQLFTELEMAYHNQFHKAFPDHRSLSMAKQLWLRMLVDLQPEHIIAGGRKALCNSDFLPSLNSIRQLADAAAMDGIPDIKAAYLQACNATGTKQAVSWSHPIIYYAGKATGWGFLRSESEARTFPVFERNFQLLAERVRKGEILEVPIAKAIEQHKAEPLDKTEQKLRLKILRSELGL